MPYALALEAIEPGHHIAWVQALPGCYSSAGSQAQAVAHAPAQIAAYFEWLAAHGRPIFHSPGTPVPDPDPSPRRGPAGRSASGAGGQAGRPPAPELPQRGKRRGSRSVHPHRGPVGSPGPGAVAPIEVRVAEVFQSFPSLDDPAYIVNAFFEDDRRVLSAKEVDFGLWALEQTRHDLRQAVSRFGPGQLTRPIAPAPKDTLERILHHLAHAEWWYFDRLGLADPPRWEDVSGDPLARLERVRAGARAVLPTLTGDARVTTRVGEQWSARKVLRRMLWHERDHTRQISLIDPASL